MFFTKVRSESDNWLGLLKQQADQELFTHKPYCLHVKQKKESKEKKIWYT